MTIEQKPELVPCLLDAAPSLSEADISRIVEMAWEDRTPFEAIQAQFGINESAVVALMRAQMKASSFKMWRVRMKDRVTKHAQLRDADMNSGQRHQAKHRIPQR
jgi:uncharacterized protein (TIGR03643 family)